MEACAKKFVVIVDSSKLVDKLNLNFLLPVEVVPSGVLFLMTNKDRPGIVGYIGSLMGTRIPFFKSPVAGLPMTMPLAGSACTLSSTSR